MKQGISGQIRQNMVTLVKVKVNKKEDPEDDGYDEVKLKSIEIEKLKKKINEMDLELER